MRTIPKIIFASGVFILVFEDYMENLEGTFLGPRPVLSLAILGIFGAACLSIGYIVGQLSMIRKIVEDSIED